MFSFNDPHTEPKPVPKKSAGKSEFSLTCENQPFFENSQAIRNKFANSKPVTTRVFAEFAEFTAFSRDEKQSLYEESVNTDVIQKVDSKFSGLKIRNFYIEDDRHFCFECKNLLRDGRCFIASQGKMDRASRYYKPVDICPRRCIHFVEAGL